MWGKVGYPSTKGRRMWGREKIICIFEENNQMSYMEKVRMTIALVVSVIVLGACGKGIVSPDGSLRADVKGQTINVFFNGFGGGDGGASVTGAAGGNGGASVVGVAGVTGVAGGNGGAGVAGVNGGDGKGKGREADRCNRAFCQ